MVVFDVPGLEGARIVIGIPPNNRFGGTLVETRGVDRRLTSAEVGVPVPVPSSRLAGDVNEDVDEDATISEGTTNSSSESDSIGIDGKMAFFLNIARCGQRTLPAARMLCLMCWYWNWRSQCQPYEPNLRTNRPE